MSHENNAAVVTPETENTPVVQEETAPAAEPRLPRPPKRKKRWGDR